MDFNLNQWRDESEDEEQAAAKLPIFLLNSHQVHNSSTAPAPLPLFVPQPTSNLSTKHHPNPNPRMGRYFSLAQWQELELQASIFRHIISGASVPPELLFLVKKSLFTPSTSQYYPLHHYNNYQPPALVQSGYWGKGGMDPEPGRCRRTDGKKWRCSRDVVTGQKYCERHMHRGRNRSRKPVEMPTSAESLKTSQLPQFSISGPLSSMDPRPSDSITGKSRPYDPPNDDGRTLRHFFDDRHDINSMASATNLSISMPGNPSSDFSLKLGTGNADEIATCEKEKRQLNWGALWGEANRVAPMGGPLAEALRTSMPTSSSPTSVLHRMAPRNSVSEASL